MPRIKAMLYVAMLGAHQAFDTRVPVSDEHLDGQVLLKKKLQPIGAPIPFHAVRGSIFLLK